MGLRDRFFKFREFKDEPKPFLDHLDDLRATMRDGWVRIDGTRR